MFTLGTRYPYLGVLLGVCLGVRYAVSVLVICQILIMYFFLANEKPEKQTCLVEGKETFLSQN